MAWHVSSCPAALLLPLCCSGSLPALLSMHPTRPGGRGGLLTEAGPCNSGGAAAYLPAQQAKSTKKRWRVRALGNKARPVPQSEHQEKVMKKDPTLA